MAKLFSDTENLKKDLIIEVKYIKVSLFNR